jgi:hypothetical protein
MAVQTKKPTATTKPINVKLRYDNFTKKLQKPRPITLVVEEKNEVFWTSEDARMEINFDPKDTPFLTSLFRVPLGGGAFSGVPSRRRAKEQTYKYTVTVIAINKPNLDSKKRCTKVRLVPPVREGKPLPTVEGTLTIRFKKQGKEC